MMATLVFNELIITKGYIIKFIRALLITNQRFGMIYQFHLSILVKSLLSCLYYTAQKMKFTIKDFH